MSMWKGEYYGQCLSQAEFVLWASHYTLGQSSLCNIAENRRFGICLSLPNIPFQYPRSLLVPSHRRLKKQLVLLISQKASRGLEPLFNILGGLVNSQQHIGIFQSSNNKRNQGSSCFISLEQNDTFIFFILPQMYVVRI